MFPFRFVSLDSSFQQDGRDFSVFVSLLASSVEPAASQFLSSGPLGLIVAISQILFVGQHGASMHWSDQAYDGATASGENFGSYWDSDLVFLWRICHSAKLSLPQPNPFKN